MSLERAHRSPIANVLTAFFEPETRAWRGVQLLGKVFWGYGVFVSSILIFIFVRALYDERIMLQQVMQFCFAAYTIWILVSVWRWRYLVRRDKFVYEPQFLDMVFPLAMYTTGTFQLSRALNLPFLATIPKYFIFVAIAAWLITFAGLVVHVGRVIWTTVASQEEHSDTN